MREYNQILQTLVGWGTACVTAGSSARNAFMVLLALNLPAAETNMQNTF
jgi:hypothetical protein